MLHQSNNYSNCDEVEKEFHQHEIGVARRPLGARLFRHAGMGSCRGRRSKIKPYPYYVAAMSFHEDLKKHGLRVVK